MMKVLTLSICLILISTLVPPAESRGGSASPSTARSFDAYGNICWEDERARLDNFAIALQNEPDTVGYIIVYDGNPPCRGEAVARAIRARRYVVEYRGVEWNRVTWRYGGHRAELMTVLQPVPRGEPELKPSPTLEQSEVQSENCRAKMYRRRKCGKS